MAATRLIALHIGKGKNIAKALNARLGYSQNPDKTDGGELISSYECSPETASEVAVKDFNRIQGTAKEKEQRLVEISELKSAVIDYHRTREMYSGYVTEASGNENAAIGQREIF